MRSYENDELRYKFLLSDEIIGWDGQTSIEELLTFEGHEFLLETLKDIPKCPVLVLGCGTGPRCLLLDKKGFSVTGIDISETAIAFARKIALKLKADINYINEDFITKKFDEKFDIIVDGHFLHCITDSARDKLLSNVNKILTKRGVFIIETMSFDDGLQINHRTQYFDEKTNILWSIVNDKNKFSGVMETSDGRLGYPQRIIKTHQNLRRELSQKFIIKHDSLINQDGDEPSLSRFICMKK